MSRPLSGKTAIITGASSGIGRTLALGLARDGAAVALVARRKERLNEVAAEIGQEGGLALVAPGDASKAADIDAVFARVLGWEAGGRKCDIVVVNAGRGLAGGILDSDESQWEALYAVNVVGAARLMRRAGLYMKERGAGDVVVLGSVVSRQISPFSAVYGASKAAVASLAEGLRREICPHGVRVSLVMPGIVLSEFQGVAGYGAQFEKGTAQFGRLLEPEDISDGIRWLLALPPHVHANELMIRPTGQTYP